MPGISLLFGNFVRAADAQFLHAVFEGLGIDVQKPGSPVGTADAPPGVLQGIQDVVALDIVQGEGLF